MIAIAICFALLVSSVTDYVISVINEETGFGPVFDLLMVVLAAYFLFDHIKQEFFS